MPQRSLARDNSELAAFLRDRREAITPLDVGLPSSGRRRTPGLRREEVASLAGVGLTWYTWFEQGRNVTVSTAFLENVARALRLDAAEHAHLFSLAGHSVPIRDSGMADVPPALTQLIADLGDRPAFVKDARWDILAWNDACTQLLGDFQVLPAGQRNSLALTFGNTSFRRSMVDWETDARRIVGRFRADYVKGNKDARLTELIAGLERDSAEFRRVWSEYAVLDRDSGHRNINVKGIGPARFLYTVLAVEGTRGLKLIVYSPDSTDPAARRFAAQMLLRKTM